MGRLPAEKGLISPAYMKTPIKPSITGNLNDVLKQHESAFNCTELLICNESINTSDVSVGVIEHRKSDTRTSAAEKRMIKLLQTDTWRPIVFEGIGIDYLKTPVSPTEEARDLTNPNCTDDIIRRKYTSPNASYLRRVEASLNRRAEIRRRNRLHNAYSDKDNFDSDD